MAAIHSIEVRYLLGPRQPVQWWHQLLVRTLMACRYRKATVISVAIIDTAAMRRAHRYYDGRSIATDVLSFAEHKSVSHRQSGYLGEVLICYPQAVRQAKQFGHSVRAEVALLFVHGLLHLLGFEHDTAAKAVKMRNMESLVLGTDISRTSGR